MLPYYIPDNIDIYKNSIFFFFYNGYIAKKKRI